VVFWAENGSGRDVNYTLIKIGIPRHAEDISNFGTIKAMVDTFTSINPVIVPWVEPYIYSLPQNSNNICNQTSK